MTTEPRAVTALRKPQLRPGDTSSWNEAYRMGWNATLDAVGSAPHPDPEPREALRPNLPDRMASIPFAQTGDDSEAVLSAVDHLLRDHDCDQWGYEEVMGARDRLRAALRVEPSSIDGPRCDYGCDACRDFEADAEARLTQEATRAERTRE